MSDTDIDVTEASRLAQRLADELRDTEQVTDPAWLDAFALVPRHLFAPAFWRRITNPTPKTEDREYLTRGTQDAAGRQRWLEVAYSDDSLVTQLDPQGLATSSSTQPGLMGGMLEALEVRPGMRVLEIGTGTGYNAALLCHRLGDEHLVSIDIDPVLVDTARHRLAGLGMHPRLVAADGLAGHPEGGPYDRVIATCSTNGVPPAWIRQTRPGGIILANVGLGVVRLVVADDHASASGKYLPGFGAFMEARAGAAGAFRPDHRQVVAGNTAPAGTGEPVTQPPASVLELLDPEFTVYAHLAQPDVTTVTALDWDSEPTTLLLAAADGSWGRLEYTDPDTALAVERGPRRLVDEMLAAHDRWITAGSPTHDRIGITADLDSRLEVWIDHPDT